jgi:hypothetical protein
MESWWKGENVIVDSLADKKGTENRMEQQEVLLRIRGSGFMLTTPWDICTSEFLYD